MAQQTQPVCLTIAGSDPSGGAGLQADLKVFQSLGAYGMAVPSIVTVQNTAGVKGFECVGAHLLGEQLAALASDVQFAAVKTGALGSAEAVSVVAAFAARLQCPLVVDPIASSSSGTRFLGEAAVRTLVEQLLPQTFLLTPNAQEAALLSGIEVTDLAGARKAAVRIRDYGARNVLVTGGHFLADGASDMLVGADGEEVFNGRRIDSADLHGTGCALSAAIAAGLAHGRPLSEAVRRAKDFLERAIKQQLRISNIDGRPVLNLDPV